MRVVLLALSAALHVQAWSIKERGAGIDSVETTFQTRLKGGGKGVTLTYVLAACGDEVGELEEDVREDEGAKYLDATELHAAAFGGRADCCEKLVASRYLAPSSSCTSSSSSPTSSPQAAST